jgi:acyl-ACP thioesterase
MEPFIEHYPIQAIHLDATGQVSPAVLLHFVQEAAGGHCLQLGLDWDSLAKKGLFWAVSRHRLEVTRLPRQGETIRVETWPMPTTRSAFPRAAAGYDEAGNLVFRCTSLWVLMNRETRQMVLPGKSGIDLDGILLGNELPAPGSLTPCQGQVIATRQVWFSELDRNGHMNNTRYLDWAMDLLPADLRRQKQLQEATLCYLSEIREGDRIELTFAAPEDGIFRVDAHRLQTDVSDKKERVFAAQLIF